MHACFEGDWMIESRRGIEAPGRIAWTGPMSSRTFCPWAESQGRLPSCLSAINRLL